MSAEACRQERPHLGCEVADSRVRAVPPPGELDGIEEIGLARNVDRRTETEGRENIPQDGVVGDPRQQDKPVIRREAKCCNLPVHEVRQRHRAIGDAFGHARRAGREEIVGNVRVPRSFGRVDRGGRVRDRRLCSPPPTGRRSNAASAGDLEASLRICRIFGREDNPLRHRKIDQCLEPLVWIPRIEDDKSGPAHERGYHGHNQVWPAVGKDTDDIA